MKPMKPPTNCTVRFCDLSIRKAKKCVHMEYTDFATCRIFGLVSLCSSPSRTGNYLRPIRKPECRKLFPGSARKEAKS